MGLVHYSHEQGKVNLALNVSDERFNELLDTMKTKVDIVRASTQSNLLEMITEECENIQEIALMSFIMGTIISKHVNKQ